MCFEIVQLRRKLLSVFSPSNQCDHVWILSIPCSDHRVKPAEAMGRWPLLSTWLQADTKKTLRESKRPFPPCALSGVTTFLDPVWLASHEEREQRRVCTCCVGMKCVCTETLASAGDSHCSPGSSSRSDSFAAPGLEMLPDTPWRMAPESVSSKAC